MEMAMEQAMEKRREPTARWKEIDLGETKEEKKRSGGGRQKLTSPVSGRWACRQYEVRILDVLL